jgi:hypothetical protein
MIRLPDFVPDKIIRGLIRPYHTIDGFLSSAEGVLLFRLANRLSADATVVEIGSWKGKSTYCIACGLRSGHMHAIDPFDASGEPGSRETYEQTKTERPLREQFEANLAPFAGKIRVHQGFSQEFVDAFAVIDFLMIDGDHSREGAAFDFTHFAPKLRPGGFVAFHDYYPHRPDFGPTWVIENLVKPDTRFREYGRADSLWVAQRV